MFKIFKVRKLSKEAENLEKSMCNIYVVIESYRKLLDVADNPFTIDEIKTHIRDLEFKLFDLSVRQEKIMTELNKVKFAI